MFLRTLPTSNYIVRIQLGLTPSTVSTVLLNNMSTSTTTSSSAKNVSTNSFGFASPKATNSQANCNICKRLLYSFEEILVCRICQDSYHWRCVRPETISHYGENSNFVCEKCHENNSLPRVSPTQRLSNAGIRIKSPDSSETDYRNFANIPSKLSSSPSKDTPVVNTVRYFEEKQQQTPTANSPRQKLFDGHHTNGQYSDETKTHRRSDAFETDDENTTTGTFQANYQYTPLKEYAATKNDLTTSNGYRNSPSPNADRQFISSRLNNGALRYNNHSTQFSSPTVDNLTLHNRQQQHFTSTTNLNVLDPSLRRQQLANNYRTTMNRSTPYLSQVRRDDDDDDSDSRILKSSYQQNDRHSNIESDSGIVIMSSKNPSDENQFLERKLTDFVQQLSRQLETDAQKLNDKLELKLQNLEHMIHQQTYIIRRQDEVIERLKTKISKIEGERDHFRERLTIHEQRESDGKKYTTYTDTDDTLNRKVFEHDDPQQTLNDVSTNRKMSTTSNTSTEPSRRSSKKQPAPRVDQQTSNRNYENESTIANLIKTMPTNQEYPLPDNSTAMSRLVSSVPLTERSAASTRLDDIIHQSNTDPSATYYNYAEIRHRTNSFEEQQIASTIHQDDERKSKRSSSSSSSTSSSSSSSRKSIPADKSTLSQKNPVLHRSLESLPRQTNPLDQSLKPNNKAASLEFVKRPVTYDDPGSIYVLPQEAPHPASEYKNTVKGWLRKQNRDSFFKRIERYYCVLKSNTLLMHKHENDRRAQKVINLRGAKVVFYDDAKHGPTLELTWTYRANTSKRYHLYVDKAAEAEQWLQGIQSAINGIDTEKS